MYVYFTTKNLKNHSVTEVPNWISDGYSFFKFKVDSEFDDSISPKELEGTLIDLVTKVLSDKSDNTKKYIFNKIVVDTYVHIDLLFNSIDISNEMEQELTENNLWNW